MDPAKGRNLATSDHVLHIRDACWTTASLTLLLTGAVLTLVGVLPGFGLEVTVFFPRALVVFGLMVAIVGGCMVYRPREVIVDASEATIMLRGPIHERKFSFDDLSHIEIQPGEFPLGLAGLGPIQIEVYDLVLCFRGGTQEATHVGLGLSSAGLESRRLAEVTGAPVIRGGQRQ